LPGQRHRGGRGRLHLRQARHLPPEEVSQSGHSVIVE
jgi:hypothetical protein